MNKNIQHLLKCNTALKHILGLNSLKIVPRSSRLLPSCTSVTPDDPLFSAEQNTGLMASLTRPAIGVERLLTFLMIPGFNLLIRLEEED